MAHIDYLPAATVQWADEHQRGLEHALDWLLGHGHWPSLAELSGSMAALPGVGEGDVSFASTIPRELGFIETGSNRLVLGTFGLCATSGGLALLGGFVGVLRVALARFDREENNALIGREDIAIGLGPLSPPTTVTALGEVVLREATFLGSGPGGPAEDWMRPVTREILRYRDRGTVDAYLGAGVRARTGPPGRPRY